MDTDTLSPPSRFWQHQMKEATLNTDEEYKVSDSTVTYDFGKSFMNRVAFQEISRLIEQDLSSSPDELLQEDVSEQARSEAMIKRIRENIDAVELELSKTRGDLDPILVGFELDELRFSRHDNAYYLPIYRDHKEEPALYYRFSLEMDNEYPDMTATFSDDSNLYINILPNERWVDPSGIRVTLDIDQCTPDKDDENFPRAVEYFNRHMAGREITWEEIIDLFEIYRGDDINPKYTPEIREERMRSIRESRFVDFRLLLSRINQKWPTKELAISDATKIYTWIVGEGPEIQLFVCHSFGSYGCPGLPGFDKPVSDLGEHPAIGHHRLGWFMMNHALINNGLSPVYLSKQEHGHKGPYGTDGIPGNIIRVLRERSQFVTIPQKRNDLISSILIRFLHTKLRNDWNKSKKCADKEIKILMDAGIVVEKCETVNSMFDRTSSEDYTYHLSADLDEQKLTEIEHFLDKESKIHPDITDDQLTDKLKKIVECSSVSTTPEREQACSVNLAKRIGTIQTQAKENIPFIAVGTSWIKAYKKDDYGNRLYAHYAPLNKLLSSLRNYCIRNGIDFIEGDDAFVEDKVRELKRSNPACNGIVLAGESTIQSLADSLASQNNENIFLAGVNNTHISIDSYIRIIEMLDLAITLYQSDQTGEAYKNFIEEKYKHLGVTYHPSQNRLTFEPPAEPMDWETLRRIYKFQTFA